MDGLHALVSRQQPKHCVLCPVDMTQTPLLYLVTSKFKAGTVTREQSRSVMAGEVVTQGRMVIWSPR